MTVLFDGEIQVSYRFIHVHPAGSPPFDAGVSGHANGLCVVPEPGALSLTIGLHTGDVPIVVEVLDDALALQPEWEEVVEVSIVVETTAYEISAFDDVRPLTLPAVGSYRVRFNASGMDLAGGVAVRSSGEDVLDSYRLQLWPAGPRPDVILRQTSRAAQYWHEHALTRSRPGYLEMF